MQTAGAVLLFGVCVSAAAATTAWLLIATGRAGKGLGRTARGLCLGAVAAAMIAGVLLQVGLVAGLGLPYVERVASAQMPVYYRVSAMWSALEGSLLLWLIVLALVAVVATRSVTWAPGRGTLWGPAAAAVLWGAVTVFAVVSVLASPFASAAMGAAPSPLLQDHVAMGLHPPLLYLGFASAAVPYAWGVAAGFTGSADARWASTVRRWTLFCWVFLTAGIGLGAWWSYAVLGWGGYWAWDPVENASLLPWLTTTALVHALLVRGSGPGVSRAVVAFAGLGFVLVVFAQFLTRSGVVQSIHAFTESPLGPVLFVVTLLALAVWLASVTRIPADPGRRTESLRDQLLAGHMLLMSVAAGIVLVGTVLPTILAATTGRLVSVGPPWYERTLAPVLLAVLILMAIGPAVPARGRPVAAVWRRLRLPVLIACVTVGVVAVLARDVGVAIAAGAVALFAVGLGLLVVRRAPRRSIGAAVSHLGVAVAALAMVAGGLDTVREASVPIGGSVSAGSVSATLLGIDRSADGNRMAVRADVLLGRDDRALGTTHAELRWYDEQGAMLTGPAIRTGVRDDIYVTLLDVDPRNATATLRLAVTPLVSWLWFAMGLLLIGGIMAGLPGRRRHARRPSGEVMSRVRADSHVEEVLR